MADIALSFFMFAMSTIGLFISILIGVAIVLIVLMGFYMLGICGVFGKKVENWVNKKLQYVDDLFNNRMDGGN